jgi:mutator protein MutT
MPMEKQRIVAEGLDSNRPAAIAKAQFIEVSAALIFRDGQLLITQRHANSHLGGLWEFPGGKRETGETFEQCLMREIREELGLEIAVGALFEEISHVYPEKSVHLKFFRCQILSGAPQPLDCAAVKWIPKAGLDLHAFPAADAQLLEKLKAPNCVWQVASGIPA